MRVLHVYGGNLYGGIEAMLATMARTRTLCPDLDAEFALCFDGRLSAELEAAGSRVHRLPEVRASRPLTVVRARRALADLTDRGRFDRVICHAAWSQGLLGPSIKDASLPLVFWAHDVVTGKPWTERLARRVRPDLVIANSRHTAAAVPNLYSDVPVAIIAPPLTIETPAFTDVERAALRAGLDTAADAVVIVQSSRIEPWKGHAVMIDALARLPGLPWIWWVAGGAQRPAEGAYLTRMRAEAERCGIADRIRFLGERSDVRRLLAAADIHCQPNLMAEPFGIAFVEALAAGVPVVTAALGGALEIVDDSCGRLVPSNDPVALALALRELIDDPQLRVRLAAAGPDRARALCDPGARMRQLVDSLTSLGAGVAVA